MQSKVKRAFGSWALSPEMAPLAVPYSPASREVCYLARRKREEEFISASTENQIRFTDFGDFTQVDLSSRRMGPFHASSLGKEEWEMC